MAGGIGVFGGTFDPVHVGHLVLAEQAREAMDLSCVLFLPAAVPPHKQSTPITPSRLRLEMLDIAIAGNEAFRSSDIELQRPGVSYTVDTLRELKSTHPDDELILIVGSDTIADIPGWHKPHEIVRLAKLAAAGRPGTPLRSQVPIEGARIESIPMPLIGISSSEIRARVAAGRSIRYLVSPGVEAFIHANRLYRDNSAAPE